ncbi:unnamed protein product [Lupinus luteus]|uniref:peroxidase n=1 Tax=Lupinus luteus TaxID=3873 RepID=A0AAV1VU40_LUPLU
MGEALQVAGRSLRKHFYKHSCPQAESIINTKIHQHVSANPNLPAKFIEADYKVNVCVGAHTIGVGRCNLLRNRLYNFTGKGDEDPSLDTSYAAFLKTKCQSGDITTTVDMDPTSSTNFNTDYYHNLLQKKGLFPSDAALLTQQQSADIAKELVDEGKFFAEFAQSMKRLGAIEVLTGSAGEIRNNCSVVNS